MNENIYNLRVLLLHVNIIIATPDSRTVLFALRKQAKEDIVSYYTDTIRELCTNTTKNTTSKKERDQFMDWFHKNINNVERLYNDSSK